VRRGSGYGNSGVKKSEVDSKTNHYHTSGTGWSDFGIGKPWVMGGAEEGTLTHPTLSGV